MSLKKRLITINPMSKKIKALIFLHALLLMYSVAGICSKLAASFDFLSLDFCIFYGGVLVILVLYALGWQQIIKRLPLNVAFANRAVTVLWGIVWGILFFGETITIGKIIGAVLVIVGVVSYCLFSKEDING